VASSLPLFFVRYILCETGCETTESLQVKNAAPPLISSQYHHIIIIIGKSAQLGTTAFLTIFWQSL
jgi:hypothetical protein